MASEAREDLLLRLQDIDEIYEAHKSITGGGRGRPAERRGAALTRAGTVLLAAALEAFVKDLFEEAASYILRESSEEERKALFDQAKKNVSGNPSIHSINMFYFHLGIPWVCNDIHWRNCTNETFQHKINQLIDKRNNVAHGHSTHLNLNMLIGWKNTVDRFSEYFETKIGEYILDNTGVRPPWLEDRAAWIRDLLRSNAE